MNQRLVVRAAAMPLEAPRARERAGVTVTRVEAGEGGKLLSSQVARSLMLTRLLGEGES